MRVTLSILTYIIVYCFTLGVKLYSSAYFGQGTGLILIDNMGCSGSESQVFSCYYTTPTNDDTHSEDAGIACLPC